MAEVEEVAPIVSSSVNILFPISYQLFILSVLLATNELLQRIFYVIELAT